MDMFTPFTNKIQSERVNVKVTHCYNSGGGNDQDSACIKYFLGSILNLCHLLPQVKVTLFNKIL